MEVDPELDTGLLEQFGSLQTVDHADLIRQMRRLVGGEDAISESCASFYLEMSNWNVHAAVGHYFDLNGGGSGPGGSGCMPPPLPSMTFVRDVTIGEGESVPPLTDFTKTWTVMNSGKEPWPEGCTLRFTQGSRMSDGRSALSDRLEVGCLPPGEKIDISVCMRSPEKPIIYQSQWRMATSTGAFFGDTIWVILSVEPTGTLALTQQMDKFHDLGTSNHSQIHNHAFSPNNSSQHLMSNLPHNAATGPGNGSGDHAMNPFAYPGRTHVLHSSTSSNLLLTGNSSAAHHLHPGAVNASPSSSFSSPHLLMRRPSSPTDNDQPVVSARNILARKISESPIDFNASTICNGETTTSSTPAGASNSLDLPSNAQNPSQDVMITQHYNTYDDEEMD